jgi:hypothetical protein
MITYIKLSHPWKEYQVWQRKKANPCDKMGNDRYKSFIVEQVADIN